MIKVTEIEAKAMTLTRFDSYQVDGVHQYTVFTLYDTVEKQTYEWTDSDYVYPVDHTNMTVEEKTALGTAIVDYMTEQEKKVLQPVRTYVEAPECCNKIVSDIIV